MRLYNKGQRCFIVNLTDLISGDGRTEKQKELSPDKGLIIPDSEVEIKKEVGLALLKKYPKDLRRMGKDEEEK